MRFIASLWRFSLLANLAFLNANLFHDLPSDENGQFVVQWNLGIGDQSSVLETSYLKSGLEQAVKDFLNLKLKCQPTKNQIKTSFRSLAIRKIGTSSGKQQILTGTGKCVGSKDDCKKSLNETDSTDRNKGSTENSSIHRSNDPCETTIFDLFDKIFVDGLFFNYNVDLEGEKQKLQESLELDFNVTFVSTKSESLESIEEVDLAFKRLNPAPAVLSTKQAAVQKDIILNLFRHFGDDLDGSLHECEQTNVMCHEDDTVKYIRISK